MDGRRDLTALDADVSRKIERVLSRHSVDFAIVFGSVARDTTTDESDLDIAVEFEHLRPGKTGYSDAYLRLRSELDAAVAIDVDIVDVHSMTPRFARVVFDTGEILIGSEKRRNELERELAGELLSVEEARERVSAAVARLK